MTLISLVLTGAVVTEPTQTALAGAGPGPVATPKKFCGAAIEPLVFYNPQLSFPGPTFPKMLFFIILEFFILITQKNPKKMTL